VASQAQVSDRLATGPKKRGILSFWLDPRAIATLPIVGIFLHFVARYILRAPIVARQAPLLVVLVIGGLSLLISARRFLAREFGAEHLAGVSIITSVILGEYLVDVIVILMLSGGTALEQFASRTASSVLDALARRMPQVAHRKIGHEVSDVKLEAIKVGDILVVFPHETGPWMEWSWKAAER